MKENKRIYACRFKYSALACDMIVRCYVCNDILSRGAHTNH